MRQVLHGRIIMTLNKIFFVLAFFMLRVDREALAEVVPVGSLASLRDAVAHAKPGDVIRLSNGVYDSTTPIVINSKGTSSAPIIIEAQTTGEVEITGIAGFSLEAPAAYIIIRGFRFTHKAETAKLGIGTRFCRWTRNVFENTGEGNYLTVSGNDHEIDYNSFFNKNTVGKFIAVRGFEKQIAERLWIHHNYFFNFSNQGNVNGAEALQFGLSGFSLSSSHSLVEYSLFEECHGENELISVKASDVTVRFNTIRDCKAQFTLRHGNRNKVYGNYFIRTPGIRFFGDDQVIHSNYFEDCDPAIQIGNGGAEVADGAPLVSHDRPDRVLVAFNTLINCKRNFIQAPRTNGLGSTFVIVSDNVILGAGPVAQIEGPSIECVWQGNIFFPGAPGFVPPAGFRRVNPGLFRDETGIYRLRANSHLVGTAVETNPGITLDMDGHPRTPPFDPGADEISGERVVARLLHKIDVGHDANSDH